MKKKLVVVIVSGRVALVVADLYNGLVEGGGDVADVGAAFQEGLSK